MLKIIRSGFSCAGKEEVKKEIKALVEDGKRSIMIVPEQQTVMSEIELASFLPSCAPLYFELTNFTRLANTVFRTLGGINGEYCDNTKKMLIMWRTVTELSHTLYMTGGRREVSRGIVESSIRAVGELESLSISAEMLSQALKNESIISDRRLYSKLSDLAKIYSLYKKLLKEKYIDGAEDSEIMAQKLVENPDFLADCKIYIDGFTSFTEPQYKLIGILSKRTEVTVILATSKHTEDFFEQTELKKTKERLIGIARRAESGLKLYDAAAHCLEDSEAISLLIDRIWRKNASFDNITLQSPEEIRIFEAENPFEEASFIASDIKRRIMDGASYRDIAIIVRDESTYSGILDGALKLSDIPFFSGAKRDAEAYELIKLIYSAYSALRSGFSSEDVITYSKCGLTGITPEECDIFESYVSTWQITGSRFTDEDIWNMNPDGYETRKRANASELLFKINGIKHRLITPLADLRVRTADAQTVREQAEVLLKFLTSLQAERRLRSRGERLKGLGEHALGEENLGLWKLICSSLDTLVEVMGDSLCNTESFVDMLKILFSGANMGKIPAHYDEVTVGNAELIRLSGKKHIYLLGVNDGIFPSVPKDSSYFTEKDRETLSLLGLSIAPELETEGARELYIFSRALSYAKESVTFSYSLNNTRFKSIAPSQVIKTVEKLTGGAVKPVRISSLPIESRLYSSMQALEEADKSDERTVKEALLLSGYSDTVRLCEESIANTDMKLDGAYLDDLKAKELYLSQSRIDEYRSCPLAYFCGYTLSLSKERKAEFDSAGVGTFIHSILENFFTALSEKNMRAADITAEERISLTESAAEKYIKELGENLGEGSTRTKIKLERLCRAALPVVEGLCEEFTESEFVPKFFELTINKKDPNTPDPIKITSTDGTGVIISGIIDRVDTYKKGDNVYVRVVDYKTGKKTFSPEDLSDGKNLQMFIYLRSITETENKEFREALGVPDGGSIIPAGALYLKTFIDEKNITSPDDTLANNTVKGEQKRLGMLLDDEEIIRAMGLKYTPLYKESSPDKITESKRKFLYSREGFKELMKTVEESVVRVADSIKEGSIKADPKIEGDHSPCDYCDYKPLCRNVRIKKK